jgi:glycerophosphoryl diester phosphodiesterase
MTERSFSQGARALVVAHRGASATAAENTLPAFESAIAAGADAVEFDVRMTADGVAVVMHDAGVGRTTDGTGLVKDLTIADVRRLRIALPGGGSTPVPTLEEVLGCCSGRVGVDVEIKNIPGEPDFDAERDPAVEATIRALHDVAFSGVVLISSFNPFSLARSRTLAAEVPTGLLSDPTVEARAALAYAQAQGHPWVLPFVAQVLSAPVSDLVREAGAGGTRLGTWLVDDPQEAVALFRAGVDAVATNEPAAIVAARAEAGLA